MIYSQFALFMLRVFGLVQNSAFKYYAYSFNDSSLASSFEHLTGKLPLDPIGHMRTARIGGHIEIGALFPVHRKTHGSDSCGEIWEQYGIHRSEVAMLTIDEINKKSLIAPGVKLGIHIRDDCWTERIAMEQSIEFIRDVIGRKEGEALENTASLETCKTNENGATTMKPGTPKSNHQIVPEQYAPNLAAVVGPGSSDPSIAVQNLLQVFHIPQIGYSATSSHLSDKIEFKYYMRVVPSDGWQARALVDLVRYFNWTYIAVVYSAGSYGDRGQEEIKNYIDETSRGTLCTAIHEKIKSLAPEEEYDTLLNNIIRADPPPQVAVCFCEGATITEILKATRRYRQKQEKEKQNSTFRGIQWIGSDSWSDRRDVVMNYENEAFGGISLKIYSPQVLKFDDYFFRLSPLTNGRNPWFVDFWEQKFKCSLRETTFALYRRICTGNESLNEDYEQDPKLSQVINSIYTVAYGLRAMYKATCSKWLKRHGRRRGYKSRQNLSLDFDSKKLLCPQMNPINGSLLYQFMRKVRFEDFSGQEIYFDGHGDPPARYDILNYQGPEVGYVKIGEWKQYEIKDSNKTKQSGQLKLGTILSINQSSLVWHSNLSGSNFVPISICSEPCKIGQMKRMQQALCCWTCIPCHESEYVYEEKSCRQCPQGSWPTNNRAACFELTVEYMRWNSAEALVAMVLATIGITATLYTTIVFARYNNTPVVKATTRELSYIILAGFFMCYATTFVIILKPTTIGCYVLRIVPGTAFAMIYGALLTKTNRIARILSGSKKRILTKKPRFMSTSAQLAITALLVGVEVSITTAILIYEPANAQHDYSIAMRVQLVCKTTTLSFLAPYGFDFFLVASCTFYAVKTRNLPENFNEAKFIGFTMYTTCVIWLAFCTIYFGSNNKGITMSLSFTLSASVGLVLLFFPKIYIIILKPERNVRSSYTTTKAIRCHFGKSAKDPLSQSLSFRSTTDSGIELASVRHRRTLTRESLHATATTLKHANDLSFGPSATSVQASNSLASSNKLPKHESHKTLSRSSTSYSASPLKDNSPTSQLSVKFKSPNYMSHLCQSFTASSAPPTKNTILDFEPNELSIIEESMVSSHDESMHSANNAMMPKLSTGTTSTVDSRVLHRKIGSQKSTSSNSAVHRQFNSSTKLEQSCQTELELLDSLLNQKLSDYKNRQQRKRTRKLKHMASVDSTSTHDNSESSFLARTFSEYGKHLKKRLTLKELEEFFRHNDDSNIIPEDDSFEALLAARLKQTEIEQKKKQRQDLYTINTALENTPFLFDSPNSYDQDVVVTDQEFQFDNLTEMTGHGFHSKKHFKKRKSETGLSVAKGLEGSLQTAMSTLVAQPSSPTDEVNQDESRKCSKTSATSTGSRKNHKRSLITDLLESSVDAVTAVVYDTLQISGKQNDSKNIESSSNSSSCNDADDSPRSAESSISFAKSEQSASMLSRFGDSIRKRVQRLGSGQSSCSNRQTFEPKAAVKRSMEPPTRANITPQSLRRLNSTDPGGLSMQVDSTHINTGGIRGVATDAGGNGESSLQISEQTRDWSFTELASRHSNNNGDRGNNGKDDEASFASMFQCHGLTAKDISQSTLV